MIWLPECLLVLLRLGRKAPIQQAQQILGADLQVLVQHPVEAARERSVMVENRRWRQVRLALHRPDPAVGPVVVQDASADQFEPWANRVEQLHVGHGDGVMPQVLDDAAPDGPDGLPGRSLLEQSRGGNALPQQQLELFAILGRLLVLSNVAQKTLGSNLFLTRSWNVPERVFFTEATGISLHPNFRAMETATWPFQWAGTAQTGRFRTCSESPSRGDVEGNREART